MISAVGVGGYVFEAGAAGDPDTQLLAPPLLPKVYTRMKYAESTLFSSLQLWALLTSAGS